MNIDVVAGIIKNAQNKILIARRSAKGSNPGKWEFPGGKIKQDEGQKDALKRELFEEFRIDSKVGGHFISVIHEYSNLTVNLHAYHINHISGEFMLIDHDSLEWVKPKEMIKYDFLEADIPIINKLIYNEN